MISTDLLWRRLDRLISALSGLLWTLCLVVIAGLLLVYAGNFLTLALGCLPFVVLSGSMEPAIPTGAIVVVDPTVAAAQLAVGDVITFNDRGGTVTHRIIRIVEDGQGRRYEVKGDANRVADPELVRPVNVRGRVVVAVPWFGYALVYSRAPQALVTGMGLVLVLILLRATSAIVRLRRDATPFSTSVATSHETRTAVAKTAADVTATVIPPNSPESAARSRWGPIGQGLAGLGLAPLLLPLVVTVGAVLTGHEAHVSHDRSMEPAVGVGATVIVRRVSPSVIQAGDLITFVAPGDEILTRRVVDSISDRSGVRFRVKAEAAAQPEAALVRPPNLRGRVQLVIPVIGYVLGLLATAAARLALAACIVGLLSWIAASRLVLFGHAEGAPERR